jgi:hypothetical protein
LIAANGRGIDRGTLKEGSSIAFSQPSATQTTPPISHISGQDNISKDWHIVFSKQFFSQKMAQMQRETRQNSFIRPIGLSNHPTPIIQERGQTLTRPQAMRLLRVAIAAHARVRLLNLHPRLVRLHFMPASS